MVKTTEKPINEWNYNFVLPSDMLTLRAVYNTDQVRARTITEYEMRNGYLQTNEENIWVEYTALVPESNWAPYFTQYAIYALASLICMPITDDESLTQYLQAIAYGNVSDAEKGGKFRTAVQQDSQLSPYTQPYMGVLADARWI